MIQLHHWSLTEIENMLPYEREVYLTLLNEHVKEENKNKPKKYNPTQIMWILFNAVKALDTEVQELKKQLKEK